MSTGRNRTALIWVAIAAVALVSVTCAEAGLESAKAYASPVLKLLAKGQAHTPVAKPGAAHSLSRFSERRAAAFLSRAGVSGVFWLVPVFFIGLLLPLGPRSGVPAESCRLAFTGPSLPVLFQRPPPQIA
jgi:hypothetical protein